MYDDVLTCSKKAIKTYSSCFPLNFLLNSAKIQENKRKLKKLYQKLSQNPPSNFWSHLNFKMVGEIKFVSNWEDKNAYYKKILTNFNLAGVSLAITYLL